MLVVSDVEAADEFPARRGLADLGARGGVGGHADELARSVVVPNRARRSSEEEREVLT